MKTCARCGEEKSLSDFYVQTASGKPFARCKSCVGEVYQQKKAGTYQYRAYTGFPALHPVEYKIWCGMLKRCNSTRHVAYSNYGGRGITVCERWMSFENFYADMGDRPAGLSIDRINNDGDYEPFNCRWATQQQQARNTRKTRVITFNGESRCLSEWADILGINVVTLMFRLDRGWSVAKAFIKPTQRRGDRVTTPRPLPFVGAKVAVTG